MKKRIYIKKAELYNSCLLATIAHAIMVSHYPELSNEHSWDGNNYNVQNNNGIRGTITFTDQYCIAAFRDDNSKRLNKSTPAEKFFKGAPNRILEAAIEDTLQYLLENINNETIPLITTSFWCIEDVLYSNDSVEEMKLNGLSILEYQFLNTDESIGKWIKYYDMSEQQVNLLKSIYNKRIINPNIILTISEDEKRQIGTEILEETIESFKEIGIVIE